MNGYAVDPVVNVKGKPLMTAYKKFADSFHRHALWFIVALAIGIYTGIKTTTIYYSNKMDESVKVGGFLNQGKIYKIIPQ